MTAQANDSSNPLVSVIVPVYNGGAAFKECLTHLLASDYPNFEVIISDDGSTDGSLEVAQQAGVITLRSPVRQGAAVARNAGANIAKGELLFFTDADVWVEKNTISSLVAVSDKRSHHRRSNRIVFTLCSPSRCVVAL